MKADLLRLEIVWRRGGVYVDCDIECHRPIDPLLAGCEAFFAAEYDPRCYGLDGPAGVNNGLFGASPHHPAVEAIMRRTDEVLHRLPPDRPDAPLLAGPRVFRDVVHRRADVRIFEQAIFHALLPHEVPAAGDRRHRLAYATHRFQLSWAPAAGQRRRQATGRSL